jgi:SpoVK/Ycf46/Vps4 family AAA+-type ATPase
MKLTVYVENDLLPKLNMPAGWIISYLVNVPQMLLLRLYIYHVLFFPSRLKTELLIQMEEASKRGIFLLCATNCPWDVDSAFLRRFQRRIYIPTPNR